MTKLVLFHKGWHKHFGFKPLYMVSATTFVMEMPDSAWSQKLVPLFRDQLERHGIKSSRAFALPAYRGKPVALKQ